MPLLFRLRTLWQAFWSSRDRKPRAVSRPAARPRPSVQRLEGLILAGGFSMAASPFGDMVQVGQSELTGGNRVDHSIVDDSNGGGRLCRLSRRRQILSSGR
jgi:hypothetical protein